MILSLIKSEKTKVELYMFLNVRIFEKAVIKGYRENKSGENFYPFLSPRND